MSITINSFYTVYPRISGDKYTINSFYRIH
nr:MAG TPA: Cell division protein [Caudoviricetes sp.]